jgi:membrane protein required for colicin V production
MLASFTGLDYTLFAVIIICLLMGLRRSAIREIFALVVWVLAYVLASRYDQVVFNWLSKTISNDYMCSILSFVLIIIATLIVGAVVNLILSLTVLKGDKSLRGRSIGALLGIGRGFVIALIVIFFLSETNWQKANWFEQSQAVSTTMPAIDWMSQHTALPHLGIKPKS